MVGYNYENELLPYICFRSRRSYASRLRRISGLDESFFQDRGQGSTTGDRLGLATSLADLERISQSRESIKQEDSPIPIDLGGDYIFRVECPDGTKNVKCSGNTVDEARVILENQLGNGYRVLHRVVPGTAINDVEAFQEVSRLAHGFGRKISNRIAKSRK